MNYTKEYRIGSHLMSPNVYMSSMSGVSDIAFRRLVKRLAGGRMSILVSEFISVEGSQGKLDPEKIRQMQFKEEERPFCLLNIRLLKQVIN